MMPYRPPQRQQSPARQRTPPLRQPSPTHQRNASYNQSAGGNSDPYGSPSNSRASNTPSMVPGHPGGPINTGSGGIKQIPLTCSGHTRPVVQLQFSPVLEDGSYLLISACKDGNPMLRIGATGDWIGTFKGHKGAVWCARLNMDASRAVTASADFSAKVWDTFSGEVLHTFQHKHIVRAVDISPDGRYVVTGGHEKVVRMYDLTTPDAAPRLAMGHEATIKGIVWDQWHGVLITHAEEPGVRIWDLRTLKSTNLLETPDAVTSVELSSDGAVISATAGKAVYFWDADTYELVKTINMTFEASCVTLHPTRARFVVGSSSDLWVRVYDLASGQELELYKGHHGPVHTVSYSPDGEVYATGSEDGTIRLWQTIPGTEYGLWQAQYTEEEAAALAALAADEEEAMLAAAIAAELNSTQQQGSPLGQQQQQAGLPQGYSQPGTVSSPPTQLTPQQLQQLQQLQQQEQQYQQHVQQQILQHLQQQQGLGSASLASTFSPMQYSPQQQQQLASMMSATQQQQQGSPPLQQQQAMPRTSGTYVPPHAQRLAGRPNSQPPAASTYGVPSGLLAFQ